MFNKRYTTTELARALGVKQDKIHSYIDTIPKGYKLNKRYNKEKTSFYYLFDKDDIVIISKIHKLKMTKTYKEISIILLNDYENSNLINFNDSNNLIVVPKELALYVDKNKGRDIFEVMKEIESDKDSYLHKLLSSGSNKRNKEKRSLFTKAFLNGYDKVEKSKYIVYFEDIKNNTGFFLRKRVSIDYNNGEWITKEKIFMDVNIDDFFYFNPTNHMSKKEIHKHDYFYLNFVQDLSII